MHDGLEEGAGGEDNGLGTIERVAFAKYACHSLLWGRIPILTLFTLTGSESCATEPRAAHVKKDGDLDSLRQRDDFKKLLAEVEAKAREPGAKPPVSKK